MPTRHVAVRGFSDDLRRPPDGGGFDEASGLLVRGDQGFDFSQQLLVAFAGPGEERRALVRRKLKGGVIELADSLITLGGHRPASLNSRWSQAFAKLQSRLTV